MSKPLYVHLDQISEAYPHDPVEAFALDVLMGLTSKPKAVSPKYFYDAEGSRLFAKITDTKDYYPTKCETEILQTYRRSMLSHIDQSGALNIVELGAGDGRKTKLLLEAFVGEKRDFTYRPVDISESAIDGITQKFAKTFPNMQINGIVSEYFEALRWLRDQDEGRNLVLFLGSNIGNFNRAQAEVFLKTMWNSLNHGDFVLLGCDLKKNIDVMLRAYNDEEGYTRRFNLNLLQRMNNELGANFDLSKFEHFGTYNVKLGAMESFLLSTEYQSVYIEYLNKTVNFKPWEPIHVEYSFKFLPQEVEILAQETGYRVMETYFDAKRYFLDAILRVEKQL